MDVVTSNLRHLSWNPIAERKTDSKAEKDVSGFLYLLSPAHPGPELTGPFKPSNRLSAPPLTTARLSEPTALSCLAGAAPRSTMRAQRYRIQMSCQHPPRRSRDY